MKNNKIFTTLCVLCSFFLLTGFFGGDQTPKEERQEILEMRKTTLNDLYKELPSAKEVVEDSIGYAVFNNVGINLLAVSTANGSGVAYNKKTGKNIFMKMFSAGVGIGLGVKDFRGIFVFFTQESLDNFVNMGWQAGAQADVAAKSGEKGEALAAAIDVAPGIILYQLTKTGLALQATIQGTKYWKDEELNK